MATFHLVNFGCRASQADGAALKRQLLEAGFEECPAVELSHIAVLNTCTVTATADAEVRRVIRRIHRLNPQCQVLVTGCYAQRAPGEIALLPGVSWVVGNSHKHKVLESLQVDDKRQAEDPSSKKSLADDVYPSDTTYPGLVKIQNPKETNRRVLLKPGPVPSKSDISAASPKVLVGEISHEFHFVPAFPDDRTRPTLKIQDGCNARCSFCVIPFVRGRSRSLNPEEVLRQVGELVGQGYQEIVLSGINLGGYGKDLDRRINLLGLIERILAETSLARLRISSIEPMDVTAALIRLVASEERMAQHFHVPLQSGSDRILRLMNRRYWTAQFAERITAIRDQVPNSGIGADVMVGFPGETAQDHAASLRFLESLPLTYVHIFPYSPRPMTHATTLGQQVNGRLARERSQEIRSVITQKRQRFLEEQIGSSLSVLTLDEGEAGSRMAISTNYLKVTLPGSQTPANTLLSVRIGRIAEGILFGFADAGWQAHPTPNNAQQALALQF